jgi:starch-binding outer membrane protein, SusD/RagB family
MRKLTIGMTSVIALALGACDFEISDLNNAGVTELEKAPTRPLVTVSATGLLDGHRTGLATPIGYISQLGILGRESFNFDSADPRYISEMLVGSLQKGSPFGGAFWGAPYSNIRLANLVIRAVDKVPDYTEVERAGIRGFARTMMAQDLLRVINTRDTNGAVIDTDKPVGEFGAIVSKPEVLARILELLDQAKEDLLTPVSDTDPAPAKGFSFPLVSGFAGFDTPVTFLRFNRAIRARVSLYAGDADAALLALGESFINTTDVTVAKLEVGPRLNFSPGAGDTPNGLTNINIFAHPTLVTLGVGDDRVARKIITVAADDAGGSGDLESDKKYTFYGDEQNQSAPVPLIRNEELILLRAEAQFRKNNKAAAIADLNIVRTISGKLPVTTLTATSSDADFITEILYNRRYSLMFEGGHSWIDARRFGRITSLPKDATDHVFNVRYPIPQAECDSRPNEPACTNPTN